MGRDFMRRLLVLFSFICGIACYSADWYTGPEVDGYERYGSYSDMSGWFEFPPGEYFAIWLDASGDHGHGHALFLDHECYDHVHAPEGHTCPETGICPYSIGHHTSYSFKGKFSAGRYWFWFDDGDFQIFRKTTCDLCGKKIESGSKHKQVCPVVSGAFYCGEESEHVSTFTCHNGIAHKVCSHISYQYQVPCGYPLKNLETCQITICQLCGETHESAKHGDGDTGGSGGSGGSGEGGSGEGGDGGGDDTDPPVDPPPEPPEEGEGGGDGGGDGESGNGDFKGDSVGEGEFSEVDKGNFNAFKGDGPDFITDIVPSNVGQSAPVVVIPFPAVVGVSQNIVIDFGAEPGATIFRTIREILAGLVYVGAFIILIKILRSLEY
ncbi:hypothetical protein [Victivallis vadensis]|uniref:hypothetical protein n=1 Tax=Victivallis vadensis TaxID=172901 RepID=UPI0001571D84|nr:hypothetical protein [Victivallis vadensis]